MKKGKLALFDLDLWTYDIAFAAERKLEDDTKLVLPFDYCKSLVDYRFEEILKKLGCTEYEGYLTGDGNFRHDIAITHPYKGNRKQERPWHYQNIRNYLSFSYKAETIHGMEADDQLSIRQTQMGDNAIIVSRDKDLRMVEGWHYGYSVAKQPEFGPQYYDYLGELHLDNKNGKRKLTGGGLRFFYSQMITGDTTDNIIGPRGKGPVVAYGLLNESLTEKQMYDAVLEVYEKSFGENALERLIENANLLWMIREMKDGKPVFWEVPNE